MNIEEIRNHWMTFRCNDRERKIILEKQKSTGKVLSDYLRYSALQKEVKANAPKNVEEIVRLLSSISKNLNQLTIVAHRTGMINENKYEIERNLLHKVILNIEENVL